MLSLEKAIQYPFKDKDWKETLGIYFLINFVYQLISQSMSYASQISDAMAKSIAKGEETKALFSTLTLMGSGFHFFTSLALFPVVLYLQGYFIDLTRHVMKGNEETHVKHGDIWERIKKGFALSVFGFVYILLILTLLIPVFLPITVAVLLGDSYPTLTIIMWILFGLLCLLFIIFTVGFAPIILKTQTYIYVKENSISEGFNLHKVANIIKKFWKELYFLYIVDVIEAALAVVSILSCCLVFIVAPALGSILAFAKTYIEGSVFKMMSEGTTLEVKFQEHQNKTVVEKNPKQQGVKVLKKATKKK